MAVLEKNRLDWPVYSIKVLLQVGLSFQSFLDDRRVGSVGHAMSIREVLHRSIAGHRRSKTSVLVENDRVGQVLLVDARGHLIGGKGLEGDFLALIVLYRLAINHFLLPIVRTIAEIDLDFAAALERLHVRIHKMCIVRVDEAVGRSFHEFTQEVFLAAELIGFALVFLIGIEDAAVCLRFLGQGGAKGERSEREDFLHHFL